MRPNYNLEYREGDVYYKDPMGNTAKLTGGSGGSSDYDDLSNKPSINGVELTGNKTSEDLNIEGGSDVFEVIYDETTYDELVTAIQAGKVLVRIMSAGAEVMVSCNIKSDSVIMRSVSVTIINTIEHIMSRIYTITNNDVWSFKDVVTANGVFIFKPTNGSFNLLKEACEAKKVVLVDIDEIPGRLTPGRLMPATYFVSNEEITLYCLASETNAIKIKKYNTGTWERFLISLGNNDIVINEERKIGTWKENGVTYDLWEKVVPFGELPNSTSKSIAHGIVNAVKFVGLSGVAISSSNTLPLPSAAAGDVINNIFLQVGKSNITVGTGKDRTNFTESYITIRFIRT